MIDLQAIEAREKGATKGPWKWARYDVNDYGISSPCSVLSEPGDWAELGRAECKDDAEFSAHARTDIPALIAEVKRLRADLEAIIRERSTEAHDAH